MKPIPLTSGPSLGTSPCLPRRPTISLIRPLPSRLPHSPVALLSQARCSSLRSLYKTSHPAGRRSCAQRLSCPPSCFSACPPLSVTAMFVAPPGYQPVYNPSIPYTGQIYGGLRPGMSIYIQGAIPENITRFTLNLLCGEYEGADIACHFNPRFDGWDKVVFNSMQGGDWGSEDKTHDMPFTQGEAFEMVIIVTGEGYQFKVNGRDFKSFDHRIPVERVCALGVYGDVSIQTINFIGGGGYPGQGGYPSGGMDGGMGGGGCYPGQNLPNMGGQPRYNPPMPYGDMIPGGMSSKRTIIIRGMVPFGADEFRVNFTVARSRDIAFHLNPRVQEGIVVRNSMIGGSWGQEERDLECNPFAEGQYFDMSIRCGNQRFKVFVNGQPLCNFFHRVQPFTQVDSLEIDGNVQISYIHF